MRIAWVLATLLVTSALAGCGGPSKVSLAQGSREYVASDYPQVLQRWTRDAQLYNEFDSPLTVTATFQSWDFNWAYVVRYAYDYRLTVEQRRVLLESTLNETRTEHEFYVALIGTNRRWVDLSRPNSAWIVRLIDDQGGETAPLKIDLIAKPGALEKTYFPYTSVFRLAFHIHFPVENDGKPTVSPDAKWFGLRFAGAEGNQELHWDIESQNAKKAAFGDDVVRGM
jgi:hypothetical protein